MNSKNGVVRLAQEGRVEVPTGVAIFPGEKYPGGVRAFCEVNYNIKRWTRMSKGGHFAAIEEPELLVKDIQDFRKQIEAEQQKAKTEM